VSKLSTESHKCPSCEAKRECGEGNYQDECPYPVRMLCSNRWSKQAPKRDPQRAKAATS
jgi:hypothetical protein